jgi:hypothetical protein
MSNPEWEKRSTDEPIWEGPRDVDFEAMGISDRETQIKIQTILGAMDWPQLVCFFYGESDRVVAPFVVGVSSEGNPLLRGYQLEGVSRSGKGAGWRMFQIRKMENLVNYQEFFNASDFDFDEYYPWIYKVFKML